MQISNKCYAKIDPLSTKFIINENNMKLYIIFISAFLFVANPFYSQFVQNKSYSAMLKALLSHNVKEIGVKEARNDSTAVFLDAREKKEYDVSHLKNATWVGYDDFNMNRVKGISKDKKIIVYCAVGYRSEKITEKLTKAGYANVINVVGGIFEWKNLGYPVVDNTGKETEKIHAYSKTWGIWLNSGEKVYH